jgi:hypothetical protein
VKKSGDRKGEATGNDWNEEMTIPDSFSAPSDSDVDEIPMGSRRTESGDNPLVPIDTTSRSQSAKLMTVDKYFETLALEVEEGFKNRSIEIASKY